jgi:hypothetical protein
MIPPIKMTGKINDAHTMAKPPPTLYVDSMRNWLGFKMYAIYSGSGMMAQSNAMVSCSHKEQKTENRSIIVARTFDILFPKTTAVVFLPSARSPDRSGSVELIEPAHISKKYGADDFMAGNKLVKVLPLRYQPAPNAITPYPNALDKKSKIGLPEKKVGLKL